MTGPVFVVTDVVVYRYDTHLPTKQSRADDRLPPPARRLPPGREQGVERRDREQ